MYRMVKPISEWRHYDCNPRRGEHPFDRDRSTGEPAFDLHQIEPMSNRGRDFLDHCHREGMDMEYRNNEVSSKHIDYFQDAVRYGTSIHKLKLRENIMPKTIMTEKQILAEALLNNFTTVLCTHQGREFTFKKPIGMELEVDDQVVVALNNGDLKTSVIEEIHDGVENPEDIKLAWVVQKIETGNYEQLLELETKAVNKIKEMEQRRTRRELMAEFSEEELNLLGADLDTDLLPKLNK